MTLYHVSYDALQCKFMRFYYVLYVCTAIPTIIDVCCAHMWDVELFNAQVPHAIVFQGQRFCTKFKKEPKTHCRGKKWTLIIVDMTVLCESLLGNLCVHLMTYVLCVCSLCIYVLYVCTLRPYVLYVCTVWPRVHYNMTVDNQNPQKAHACTE